MDHAVLRKRLNTFKSSEGRLQGVSDEVIIDVLRAWENWPGTAADLYRDLGLSKMQMVTIIQKAKNLVKSGVVTESEFREVSQEAPESAPSSPCPGGIELAWQKDKVIRFSQVDHLVEFLKKTA